LWEESGGTGWWRVYLGSQKRVHSYELSMGAELQRAPKNWTFEGSNNGIDWTVLDTQTDITYPGEWESGPLEFTLADPSGLYSYYQIKITANNGDASYSRIGEIYMYEAIE
jgi:hypothetical protein